MLVSANITIIITIIKLLSKRIIYIIYTAKLAGVTLALKLAINKYY